MPAHIKTTSDSIESEKNIIPELEATANNHRDSTKFTILDKAQRYAGKLKNLEVEVHELVARGKEAKISRNLMNDVQDSLWKKRFEAFLELLPQFEAALAKLLKLAFDKYQLKESADIRPVRFFKTGNLKDKIDQLIPDAEFYALANKLSKAYKYMSYFGANGNRLYITYGNNHKTTLHYESYKTDLAKMQKLIEKAPIEIDYESLNNLMGDLLKNRNQVIDNIKALYGKESETGEYLTRMCTRG